MAGPRLAFIAEWQDPVSGIQWKYQLFYFPESLEVEMIDIKNRRTFLKKTRCEDINPALLFEGSKITVFGRQLTLLEFADDATRYALADRQERTLAMIKPDAVRAMGPIMDEIYHAGLQISKLRFNHLSKQEACAFYSVHKDRPFFEALTDFMSSGPSVAMELVGPSAIQTWRTLLGPTNTETARAEAPQSLRARFGTDNTMNACHGSDAPETAEMESNFFFGPSKPGRTFQGRGTTLAIVKPHAVQDGGLGGVMTRLMERFLVTGAEMFSIDRANAAEFLEVYRGVIAASEYSAMVEELTAGPLVAVEVADRDGADAVEALRELAGPSDPEIARLLRPNSIRAAYGVTKVKNALHVTDLPEDGELEVNYFFTLMQQQ